jgi:type II secretory ATPase GspE/PulE/Tfp pilus assembly ATPase PilB-like protein
LAIEMSVVACVDTWQGFNALIERARARDPQFATDFANAVLRAARDAGASDVHLDPTASALAVRWRLVGVLLPLCDVP